MPDSASRKGRDFPRLSWVADPLQERSPKERRVSSVIPQDRRGGVPDTPLQEEGKTKTP